MIVIKRLRRKFMWITTGLCMVLLLVIFGLIYGFTARGMRENLSPGHGRPGLSFSAVQMENGQIIFPNPSGVFSEFMDGQTLQKIMTQALSENQRDGFLKEYDLRYMAEPMPGGIKVTFYDTSFQREMLGNLMETFVIIGVLAFFGFLFLSWALARWAVRPVERAWQQQRQFVADASHELKTPLTVVLTNGELLQGECDGAERQRLAGNILTMSRRMRALVEDMLQLARADNGQNKGTFEPVDFSRLIQDAALLFEPVYFEEGRILESEIAPGVRVRGIRQELQQLLEILLDNGRKYSAPGGTSRLSLSIQGKKAVLRMFTPGTPLTAQQCRDVFRRFYRVDEARTDGSSGLGLSIAQRITENHKARLTASPAEGGNVFTFVVPVL